MALGSFADTLERVAAVGRHILPLEGGGEHVAPASGGMRGHAELPAELRSVYLLRGKGCEELGVKRPNCCQSETSARMRISRST